MKDVGTNFASMIATLKSKISCDALSLPQHFDGSCFGHAMNEVVQYATKDNKIFKELAPINVKSTQTSFKAYIIWRNKSGMLI